MHDRMEQRDGVSARMGTAADMKPRVYDPYVLAIGPEGERHAIASFMTLEAANEYLAAIAEVDSSVKRFTGAEWGRIEQQQQGK